LNYFPAIPPTLVSATLCAGETYTLPNGQIVSAAGTYPLTLQASNGCDSVVQTTLNYFPAIPPTLVSATLCAGETYTLPNGQIVSAAGTYPVTLQASNGCDSIIQTTLNYFPTIPPTLVSATLCAGETYTLPNGQIVCAAGTYPVTLQASNGCDSVIQTTLSYYLPIAVDSVSIQPDNGSSNGSITIHTVSGGSLPPYQFEWSNGATDMTFSNLSAGTYQVTVTDVMGCEAIFSYKVELMIGTSALSREVLFQVSPNPFSTQIQVVFELENAVSEDCELRLFDAQGRLCNSFSIQEGKTQDLPTGDLPAGVYLAQLLEGDKVVATKRLLRQ
jgi:hypothetical protein